MLTHAELAAHLRASERTVARMVLDGGQRLGDDMDDNKITSIVGWPTKHEIVKFRQVAAAAAAEERERWTEYIQRARKESELVERPVRRVVCAALRAADGRLLLGVRHYSADMHAQLALRDDRNRFQHLSGDDQGFVDQHGVYMTRREAYDVAVRAGQIVNHDACEIGLLYSEGLY